MTERMEPIQPVIGAVFGKMAAKYFPQGSIFRCLKCGAQRSCTTSEIAEGMAKGWPHCRKCGVMVDLVTPRDK